MSEQLTLVPAIVVDASVLAKLLLVEPDSQDTYGLLTPALDTPYDFIIVVPELLFSECGNILWKNVVRRVITHQDDVTKIGHLLNLRLAVRPERLTMENAVNLACAMEITAYDAAYIETAHACNIPFLTADRKLVDKIIQSTHIPPVMPWFLGDILSTGLSMRDILHQRTPTAGFPFPDNIAKEDNSGIFQTAMHAILEAL